MSVSRRFVAAVIVSSAVVALVVSFAGVASGAASPSQPSAIVSVHADPGHVSAVFAGTSCGGYLTVEAKGRGGGSGKVSCGRTSASVAASSGGSYNSTYGSPTQATLVCQANALHASRGVDVVCTENVD